MPYVEVWVDSGDLEDFDDDALLEECMKRNLIPACYVTDSDQAEHLNRIFEAIKLGRDADALQLTRIYVQDVTGKVLP